MNVVTNEFSSLNVLDLNGEFRVLMETLAQMMSIGLVALACIIATLLVCAAFLEWRSGATVAPQNPAEKEK